MKYIHFKEGVDCGNVKLVLLDGLFEVMQALEKFNYTLVVTSLCEGKHMGNGSGNSLHPRGYAADIRTRDMRVADVPVVVRELRMRLGKDWDIVQEVDHIHIEYDPQHDGGKTLP